MAASAYRPAANSTDLVLVANNKEGFQHLLHDKLKLGGDVAVAASPVGRNSQAAISATANAALLSYSRSKGIFAGIDLTGDVVDQNQEDTRAYHGNNVSHETILTGGVPTPASAQAFVRTVNQLFHHASERGRREPEPPPAAPIVGTSLTTTPHFDRPPGRSRGLSRFQCNRIIP